ncbi:hypothetical protein [Bradyrhizobium ottawaense]|nr:hypothetical protein [Bradyrhizobium ottawaense]
MLTFGCCRQDEGSKRACASAEQLIDGPCLPAELGYEELLFDPWSLLAKRGSRFTAGCALLMKDFLECDVRVGIRR